MSYNKDTALITAPVAMSDVQNALGISTKTLSGLCTSANINKWSKCKPIRSDEKSQLSSFAGSDTQWGLTIPTINPPYGLVSGYSDSNWEYNKPRGVKDDVVEYYRLLDFDGYYHAAVPPVKSGHAKGTIISVNAYDTPSVRY
jgi:hypothetical protein